MEKKLGLRMEGKPLADKIAERTLERASLCRQQGVEPCVAVIAVEGDPATDWYVKAKRKMADKLGIRFELYAFGAKAKEAELLERIAMLNADPQIHGIMLELPLPAAIDARRVIEAIAPHKDVDGLTPANRLALMTGERGLVPATPQACIRLLKHYGYSLAGKHAVVIGRGETVGQPLFHLLQREQATVTVCHSRTVGLEKHVEHAEFVFAAAGRQGLVRASMIQPGTVVVDAGINELEAGGIAGDVEAEAIMRAEAMTPVPGGVGTVTTAILFENVMLAAERQLIEVRERKGCESPVVTPGNRLPVWNGTIRSFVDLAASRASTPGGGSVAALVAALGASMVSMVANLSTGPKFAAIEAEARTLADQMSGTIGSAESLLEEDMAVFHAYMAALKLPKQTEIERQERADALRTAAVVAADVPMRLARLCVEGIGAAAVIGRTGNKTAISDLGIGVLLLDAAMRSAALTAQINLPYLGDEQLTAILREELACLEQEADASAKAVLDIVSRRMNAF